MAVGEAIARVRRAMPRNADVMAICDEVERLTAALRSAQAPQKVDRKTYMREYMQRRRKAERKAK